MYLSYFVKYLIYMVSPITIIKRVINKHICDNYMFSDRSSLQDQNTKVAVVLIQKNAPLPPGKA